MMEYLKSKNLFIEGVAGTGKANLVENMREWYNFTLIEPTTNSENQEKLFLSFIVMAEQYPSLIFKNLYLSTLEGVEQPKASLWVYKQIPSEKNRFLLLECDYDTALQRVDDKRKIKSKYNHELNANRISQLVKILSDKNPEFYHRINTGDIGETQTIDEVLRFMSR